MPAMWDDYEVYRYVRQGATLTALFGEIITAVFFESCLRQWMNTANLTKIKVYAHIYA